MKPAIYNWRYPWVPQADAPKLMGEAHESPSIQTKMIRHYIMTAFTSCTPKGPEPTNITAATTLHNRQSTLMHERKRGAANGIENKIEV